MHIALQVIGIDPDTDRLEVARRKYSASNIEYLTGRAENIPGVGYDIIFSSNVLHWCKDKNLVFEKISGCLKKNGKLGFIITGTTNYDLGTILFSPEELMLNPKHRQHMMSQIHPSPTEIAQLTSKNGLALEYLKEEWQEWKFEDAKKLIEFYLTNFQYKGVFDRSDFNTEAIKKYYGEREFSFSIPYITVIAQKIN